MEAPVKNSVIAKMLEPHPDIKTLHVVVNKYKDVRRVSISGINRTGFKVHKSLTTKEFNKLKLPEEIKAFIVEINLTLTNVIPTLTEMIATLEGELASFPEQKGWLTTAYTLYRDGRVEVNTDWEADNFPNAWKSNII